MTDWGSTTWLVTGTSAGFGMAIAQEVLRQGGKVVATARDCATLDELVRGSRGRAIALTLDVRDRDQIREAVARAEEFGGADVLVNNAGYGFLGGVEESAEDEIEAQMEVNFTGPLHLIRAVLPGMRRRGRGFIINMSSISGVRSFPGSPFYGASKFALEGLSEALAGEVSPFGIGVMIVEPGYFRTEFAGRSLGITRTPHPDYPELAERRAAASLHHGRQPGDPARAPGAIIQAMNSPNPPLRLLLGSDAYAYAKEALETRLAEVEASREVAESTDYPS